MDIVKQIWHWCKENLIALSYLRNSIKSESKKLNQMVCLFDPYNELTNVSRALTKYGLFKVLSYQDLDEFTQDQHKSFVMIYPYGKINNETIKKLFDTCLEQKLPVITFYKWWYIKDEIFTANKEVFEKKSLHTFATNELTLINYVEMLLKYPYENVYFPKTK